MTSFVIRVKHTLFQHVLQVLELTQEVGLHPFYRAATMAGPINIVVAQEGVIRGWQVFGHGRQAGVTLAIPDGCILASCLLNTLIVWQVAVKLIVPCLTALLLIQLHIVVMLAAGADVQ